MCGVCRMAEALVAQERHDYQQQLRAMELAQLEDLMRGPALSVQQQGYERSSGGCGNSASAATTATADATTVEAVEGECSVGGVSSVQDRASVALTEAEQEEVKRRSFATITQVSSVYSCYALFLYYIYSSPS